MRTLLQKGQDRLKEFLRDMGFDKDNPRFYGFDDGPWLTLGSDMSSEVTVSWVTAKRCSTMLALGSDPDALEVCYSRSLRKKYHHAPLTGLSAGSTYYYKIVSPFAPEGENTVHQFTLPVPGALRFSLVGDAQPTTPVEYVCANRMAQALAREKPGFIIQLGDSVHRGTVQEYWHYTLRSWSPVGPSIPTQRVMGNHDWGYDQGKSWRRFFNHPYSVPKKSYYAHDIAPARLIMLDPYEDDESMGAGQLTWLEEQLATTPEGWWRLVFLHASIFSTGMENMDYNAQRLLIPLFDRYGVDAVFFGHDHMYEHYHYCYGDGGRLFSSSHTWAHTPVHYFLSGGGGAPLEPGFGLLEREPTSRSRTWWDSENHRSVWESFGVRQWDEQRHIDGAPQCGGPARTWYHSADAPSQDDAAHFGITYGETAHHYLNIEITGDVCRISAHYPDGSLMTGPGGKSPQEYVLTKK